MPEKLTRQGVRDLDAGRPKRGKTKHVELPLGFMCKHPATKMKVHNSGDTECKVCGQMWDWNGDPYTQG